MIDWSRVDDLVEEIGAEDFTEIADLFLSEVDTAIGQLEECAGNPVLTEEHMHFLKGAALNLGFETLANLCFEGEKSAAAGNPDKVSAAEVRNVFDASHARFRQDLPARLAA